MKELTTTKALTRLEEAMRLLEEVNDHPDRDGLLPDVDSAWGFAADLQEAVNALQKCLDQLDH